jgi:hypothetical protein
MTTKTKSVLVGVLVFIVVVIGLVGAVAAGVAIGRRFAAPAYTRFGPQFAQPAPPQPRMRAPIAQQYAPRQRLAQQFAPRQRLAQQFAPRQRLAQQFAPRRGFALGEKRGFFGADTLEAAANALGMKPADVTSALRDGKTLADLAKEKNVDEAKVKTAIADAEKAALDRAVQDGLITKERADALKAKIDPSKIDLSRQHFAR